MNKKIKLIIIAVAIIAVAIWAGIVSVKPSDDSKSMNVSMVMHIHPRLYIEMDGQTYMVPQNVGIDPSMWKDHSLDQYGMTGMAPLHTHTNDGMIHVESNVKRDYTLGEFLDIWGIDLKGKTVNATSNGEPIPDYRTHVLKDEESIILKIQ
ncbi:MAG: hypothetical protein HY223_08365 [Thaumarchaeota archaeon]|nr:hypothetical protein [Nitrososphaerota archaeon]